MADRGRLVQRLAELAGSEVVTVIDRQNGWPGVVRIHLPSGDVNASIHVGPIGLSHRERDSVERRFQNPGQNRPVQSLGSSLPLLLGVWEQGQRPLLVGMEAESRLGKLTRQSLFIPLWLLGQAEKVGWAQHYSSSGELIVAFHPALLAAYVEMRRVGLTLQPEQVEGIVTASGLIAEVEESARDRVRRASFALVRSAQFSQGVVDAYGGLCAMCGLNFGLVEGAHIYPVKAPGAPDTISNGLALCANHHSAFDRYLLWVNPETRDVILHPKLIQTAPANKAGELFVEITLPKLTPPVDQKDLPRSEMFEKRYEFFGEKYNWAT